MDLQSFSKAYHFQIQALNTIFQAMFRIHNIFVRIRILFPEPCHWITDPDQQK